MRIVGDDGSNTLEGTAGADLIYGFDPGGPQAQVSAIRHGQAVRCETDPRVEVGRRVRLYGPDSAFLGLAEALPEGRLQPRRLILPSAS